jgi:hypothetical protein
MAEQEKRRSIRIISTGWDKERLGGAATKVIDVESGEMLLGVQSVDFHHDVSGHPIATIKLIYPEVEILTTVEANEGKETVVIEEIFVPVNNIEEAKKVYDLNKTDKAGSLAETG